MQSEEVAEVDIPPHVGPHVQMVRNVGYTLESSLADILDNSLSAQATAIEIGFEWNEGDPHLYVLDNGKGMDKATLHEAMRIGSQPLTEKRTAADHGKFSVGMKTASFSIGRQLTVISKQAAKQAIACMDLDAVEAKQKWFYRSAIPAEARPYAHQIKNKPNGTLLIIRKIDRFGSAAGLDRDGFYARMEELARGLEFTFHCILQGTDPLDSTLRENYPKVRITFNGIRDLEGFDALLYGEMKSDWKKNVNLAPPHDRVKVKWGTLPTLKDLDSEMLEVLKVHGDLHLMDGFYVYRNRRLICFGSWLGMGIRRDDATRLARVVISLPDNTLDKEWGIDIGKSKVTLPKELRSWFRDFARRAQEAGRNASGIQGETRQVRPPGAIETQPIYVVERTPGGAIIIRINEEHPRVREMLRVSEGPTRELLATFEFRIDKEMKQWLNLL